MSTTLAPKVVSFASEIDQATIDQAKQIASMPFVYPHLALMPDAHSGKGSAVGTVIPTKGAVIPAAVGVDIGCGMIAVKTRFTWSEIRDTDTHGLDVLRRQIEEAIPLSPGNYNSTLQRFSFTRQKHEELIQLQQQNDVDLSHSPKWMEQLGSLGGGNHFIELCVDDEDNVWLFLHSGSRGVGNKIAQVHIKAAQAHCKERYGYSRDKDRSMYKLPHQDLAFLEEGTIAFDTYLNELEWAQRFAYLNRAEMMDRYIEVFAWWLGVQAQRVEVARVNCHHNYTVPTWIDGERVWLTRKGAVDATEGKLGVIPGSMGTRSYVVRGKGNEDGLKSAPHGAGRRFSRTKAKEHFTVDDLKAQMQGIEWREDIAEKLVDEIPSCYKDIDQVMADAEPLVEVVTSMRQVLNVKGT
ncbi:RtcB-like RNA ligase [Mycobacterium phage MrMagoo]|uniref:3'-phosphate/5'-hydroxy nucleic acid ligase n=1 Tax=Mycobacterium phage MrMagoo TaxID=1927020 RepID=A0A1L6BYP0_9CAUD|nr:tRNA splicing ligase [Mycobacterium phage MrMagoo]APQ42214.1 RtcB-like RNA ligase [Mycobacterium phage MrMagoo]ARM70286.1 RtcB-like RNA ligase [Mycobacterium phage GardenSalsa]